MRSDADGAVAGGESGVRREPASPARRAGLREDLRIDARFGDVALILHSTWGLFSPREIDPGTRLLLDQVRPGVADRCLDLGCGYGPIGLCLAARAPAGSVMLVDRDFVAVDYARANARRNGLDQVEARLSNGFDQLEGMRFDLVASNLPAKVGREMLRILIEDAHAHLEPGGRFVCVIISGLRTAVGRDLASVFGSCVKLKQGARHTVLEARRALG